MVQQANGDIDRRPQRLGPQCQDLGKLRTQLEAQGPYHLRRRRDSQEHDKPAAPAAVDPRQPPSVSP
jgi:hypothetical protein